MRSKSRKQIIGTGRTTENKAIKELLQAQTNKWVEKIKACDLNENEIAKVMIELVKEIESGVTDREVMSYLLKRLPLKLSLEKAYEIIKKERRNDCK